MVHAACIGTIGRKKIMITAILGLVLACETILGHGALFEEKKHKTFMSASLFN